ncbi:ABC transporter ATP-binding protein [Ferrimicrobium acidiphilum]|uniref:ABC transporter ATP-binding protein n=1 Tax=Ferrimicrobium acidiphilum TaxID=121039 RepID=UPI0023F1B23E|nr:ABC transporter ATP-binding protein [Ferrimicrobium acidiphilum]
MNDAIEVKGLTISYGTTLAVDQLTFGVGFGEVVGVLGPNGAGKTSTLETIEGYRRPTHGSVRVLGLDPAAKQAQLSREMGVMLQEGGIPARMTVKAALSLYSRFYDHPRSIAELTERLNLSSVLSTPYRRLSGGEKQRLSLALALIGGPRVLLLDEPTAGVDPEGKAAIRELITDLRAASVAILMTGHELEEIDRIVDQVLIIDRGKERAHGSPAELRQAYGGEGVEFTALSDVDCGALGSRLGTSVRSVRANRYRVEAEPTTELLGHLLQILGELGIEAQDVATVSPSLEEIYLSLIGSSQPSQSAGISDKDSTAESPRITPEDQSDPTSKEDARG